MTLQQLHYVLVIAEAGSLNRAAEQLYLSQPSLTSAVRELEKELGIVLFNRSGRGVTPTQDGAEFLLYARQLYHQYESLMDKYSGGKNIKRKFGVSTQHYSFAVKAFVELVKRFDTSQYEFAIRETKTRDVISDVATLKSEIGIVYLWTGHPLAGKASVTFDELREYPCLSFEQGDASSFYFAEEILSTNEYTRTIKANDRATMLNLMIGLNGYTLCSGIICEELNGDDYVAVPFCADSVDGASNMDIGYIVRQDMLISDIGKQYICELQTYLRHAARSGK